MDMTVKDMIHISCTYISKCLWSPKLLEADLDIVKTVAGDTAISIIRHATLGTAYKGLLAMPSNASSFE